MENRKIIQVEEKVPPKLLIPLSIQHMFAMFGASVLVPSLFCNCSFYERYRNLIVYLDNKRKGACIFGLQLCIYCPVFGGYGQVWL